MADLNTPIRNGFLEDSLDANSQAVINLLQIVIGGASGSAAIHLSPGGTPTGAADGIWFGNDAKLYRSDSDTLRLLGGSAVPKLHMSSGFITNLADPVNPQDAATRAWSLASFATGAHQHNAATAFSSGTVTHEYGGLEADVSAYAGVVLISGGATTQLKYNRVATTAPGVTDDTSDGYTVGSRWIDVTGDEEYVCLDATEGAAVWTRTTAVGGGGAAQLSDLSDVGTAPNTANFFLATPNGSTGDYSGRAIVAADIPSLAASKIGSGTLLHERGGLEADVSAYAGVPYIVSGTTVELKMNFGGTVAPTANDDSGDGYRVGSRWIDIVADAEYVCVNSTLGAAVWLDTSGGSSSVSQLADLSDVGAAADTANFVLATPNSINGVYSGRALVANDIPNLNTSKLTGGTLALARGGLAADLSAYDGVIRVASGATSNLKYNLSATTDPAVTSDTAAGYSVGSRWINVTLDKEFVCLDASNGAAVWTDTTASGGAADHGGLSGLADDDHTQYLLTAATRASTGIQEFLGLNFTDPTELTIVSGAITLTQGAHTVDTEGDASSDDLVTITAAKGVGDFAIIMPAHTDRSVVLKHGTGNIYTFNGSDITLDTADHWAVLFRNGARWVVMANSAGGGVTDHGALTGLADDDHSQYLLTAGTRAGTGMQEFRGLNFADPTILTLSSDACTATQTLHIIAAQSGTTDNLATITAAKGVGDLLIIAADTGDTITIKHSTGNIRTCDARDATITPDSVAILLRMGTNWLVVASPPTFPLVDTTALVRDPANGQNRTRLDAGAVTGGAVRAIQGPDGDCKILDCIQFDVLSSSTAWTLSTFWLGNTPAQTATYFVVKEISWVAYNGDGLSAMPSLDLNVNGSALAAVAALAFMDDGYGLYGWLELTISLSRSSVLTVTIQETGEGTSGGNPAYGLVVSLLGYWTM